VIEQSLIDFINSDCGGVPNVSEKLGISTRAVYKWTANGSLPRTEYSDETSYSDILSELSGETVTAIKDSFKPQPVTKAV